MKGCGRAEDPLKANTDAAIEKAGTEVTTLVVKRTGGDVAWRDGKDFWLHEELEKADADCPPEEMNAEDPLFIAL